MAASGIGNYLKQALSNVHCFKRTKSSNSERANLTLTRSKLHHLHKREKGATGCEAIAKAVAPAQATATAAAAICQQLRHRHRPKERFIHEISNKSNKTSQRHQICDHDETNFRPIKPRVCLETTWIRQRRRRRRRQEASK